MIEVLSNGFYSSIQDLGRFGYTQYGVPLSGAMDQNLSHLANLLVGNKPDEAVVEMTFLGSKLKFHKAEIIAISAPDAKIFLNKKPLEKNHQIKVNPGDILDIKSIKNRAYLAAAGGFDSEVKLGSQSQYDSITKTAKLQKGEKIPIKNTTKDFHKKHASVNYNLSCYNTDNIEVYILPEYHQLKSDEKEILASQSFKISEQSNRMAYQLHENLPNALKGMRSVPVMPGTVQLTPEGKIIILMRDAQVTGGYPRIFQLTEQSINILSQKPLRSRINFKILKI